MSRIYQPQAPFKPSSFANSNTNGGSAQASSSSSSASVSPSVSATNVQAPSVGSVAKLFGAVNTSNSNGQSSLKSSFTTLNGKETQQQ
jgi:hypothetical protein